MIDRGKRDVLGVSVSVTDCEAAVSKVIDAAKKQEPLGGSALAVHGVLQASFTMLARLLYPLKTGPF